MTLCVCVCVVKENDPVNQVNVFIKMQHYYDEAIAKKPLGRSTLLIYYVM